MNTSPGQRVRELFQPTVFTRRDLVEQGLRGRYITHLVRSGTLIRLRRNRYVRAGVDDTVADAVRMGGRVTCLALLRLLGVFVLADSALHVEVRRNSSRFRYPTGGVCRIHWADSGGHPPLHVTSIATAIAHSVRCQPPRAMVATLDSLVNQRLATLSQLQQIFADLPARYGAILTLVDPTADSGPETFVRLMLRALGVPYETQVFIAGVGYVDFVVDGWLIIECDSKEFHEGWAKQKQDRSRDIAAARLGYITVRPLAVDIFNAPGDVQQALREIIEVLGPRFTSPPRSQLRKKSHRAGLSSQNPRFAPGFPEL